MTYLLLWLSLLGTLQLPPTETLLIPSQPTAVTVVHRNGQTFITWQERVDLSGERYRVYRAAQPITAASLGQAALLYEVAEGSALFFANRYADYSTPPKWSYRYAERLRIADNAPELSSGTGLLVWTIAAPDLAVTSAAYYAVTTVANGEENRTDFATNTAGPVNESIAQPTPVRFVGPNGWLIYLQYRDLRNWNPTFNAPNPLNGYYDFQPTDYGVPGALQYAYDAPLHVPDPAACGGKLPATLPVLLTLHAWGGDHYGPAGSPFNWCSYIVAPVDQSETWWFGFAQGHDYRKGGYPLAGDFIVNYTEQRVFDLLDFLMRQPPGPPVDAQRIYVDGHSMGGGGSLALALRYPNVFAAANASKPVTDHRTSGWDFSTVARWGALSLNLPVVIDAPHGWADHLKPFAGAGVWDWQNLQADLARRPAETRTPLNADFGINDTAVPWGTQGAPMLERLAASGQPWSARVGADGHNWGNYAGLAPNYRRDATGAPFAGLTAVRNETVPGFSAVSADGPIPPAQPARYHQSLYWSSSWQPWDGRPTDAPAFWQMSICTVADPAAPVCGTGQDATADITLRRLQAFEVRAGQEYVWVTRGVESGSVVGQGRATGNATGDGALLTLPAVQIPSSGARISVRPVGEFSVFLPAVLAVPQ